jgi:hypothetical protein
MKNIDNVNLHIVQNGEHFKFSAGVLKVLKPSLVASTNLVPQRAQLQQTYDKMGEVYLLNRAYEKTSTIQELDHDRDQQFKGFKGAITFYQATGTAAQKSAAAAIAFLLKPYKLAAGKSYINNTAQLGKFIVDVTAPTYAAHLTTLNLTDAIDQLKGVNDSFDAIYDDRSGEMLNREEHEKIRALRGEWDAVYRVVAQVLPSLHLVETDAAKKQALATAIDEINALLLQLRHVLERRGKTSTGHTDDDSPSDETPEYPENPDDGGSDNPGGGDEGSDNPMG